MLSHARIAGERVEAREPRGRAVEQEELRKLFKVCAADSSPAGRRDAALLAVLYSGGLRRAEVCALDLADFDARECALTVRSGKARQDRTVFLSPKACRLLKAWTAERGGDQGPLFNPISGAGEVRVDYTRTTTAPPLATKAAVRSALGTVGSRWTVGESGSDTPPQAVTVVRSSSTSVWVQPDGAPAGARPRWVKLNPAAWGVHPDGFDDVDTFESWRRAPSAATETAA